MIVIYIDTPVENRKTFINYFQYMYVYGTDKARYRGILEINQTELITTTMSKKVVLLFVIC